MYSTDWNQYMAEIQQQLRQQEEKIRYLERKLTEVETELRRKVPTTIEKIEYKFDQLKIETLSGSLHIGLSPEELKKLDDLTLPSSDNMYGNDNLQPLYNNLQSYLRTEGPTIIQQLAQIENRKVDDGLMEMLIQDLEKQLPDRIRYYQETANEHHPSLSGEAYNDYIMNKIKEEIHRSLKVFLKNPKE
ncbi:putative spore germination protein GerPC [Compostibacillus humi]|uniref:Putative spore germination protein GerPC n=1 Tax=Compostibacillus humi TaxID=1245525 RepID=A0A8J3EJN2_9BACI|nr:spore germination protein GerPC [Compostibacillus humi]GGH73131.1 putative spore germination protein GerPC [Compostibacillus humi]